MGPIEYEKHCHTESQMKIRYQKCEPSPICLFFYFLVCVKKDHHIMAWLTLDEIDWFSIPIKSNRLKLLFCQVNAWTVGLYTVRFSYNWTGIVGIILKVGACVYPFVFLFQTPTSTFYSLTLCLPSALSWHLDNKENLMTALGALF